MNLLGISVISPPMMSRQLAKSVFLMGVIPLILQLFSSVVFAKCDAVFQDGAEASSRALDERIQEKVVESGWIDSRVFHLLSLRPHLGAENSPFRVRVAFAWLVQRNGGNRLFSVYDRRAALRYDQGERFQPLTLLAEIIEERKETPFTHEKIKRRAVANPVTIAIQTADGLIKGATKALEKKAVEKLLPLFHDLSKASGSQPRVGLGRIDQLLKTPFIPVSPPPSHLPLLGGLPDRIKRLALENGLTEAVADRYKEKVERGELDATALVILDENRGRVVSFENYATDRFANAGKYYFLEAAEIAQKIRERVFTLKELTDFYFRFFSYEADQSSQVRGLPLLEAAKILEAMKQEDLVLEDFVPVFDVNSYLSEDIKTLILARVFRTREVIRGRSQARYTFTGEEDRNFFLLAPILRQLDAKDILRRAQRPYRNRVFLDAFQERLKQLIPSPEQMLRRSLEGRDYAWEQSFYAAIITEALRYARETPL